MACSSTRAPGSSRPRSHGDDRRRARAAGPPGSVRSPHVGRNSAGRGRASSESPPGCGSACGGREAQRRGLAMDSARGRPWPWSRAAHSGAAGASARGLWVLNKPISERLRREARCDPRVAPRAERGLFWLCGLKKEKVSDRSVGAPMWAARDERRAHHGALSTSSPRHCARGAADRDRTFLVGDALFSGRLSRRTSAHVRHRRFDLA
jgi:hypothetical protein